MNAESGGGRFLPQNSVYLCLHFGGIISAVFQEKNTDRALAVIVVDHVLCGLLNGLSAHAFDLCNALLYSIVPPAQNRPALLFVSIFVIDAGNCHIEGLAVVGDRPVDFLLDLIDFIDRKARLFERRDSRFFCSVLIEQNVRYRYGFFKFIHLFFLRFFLSIYSLCQSYLNQIVVLGFFAKNTSRFRWV